MNHQRSDSDQEDGSIDDRRSFHSSASGDSDKIDLDLDYRDSWPKVEVTVAINEILQVDLKDLTFEADFAVYLDWLDPKLKQGEHYDFNAEKGKFELAPTLQKLMAEDQEKEDYSLFNPVLDIVNGKKLDLVNTTPAWIIEEECEDGKDVPWLCKKFEFIGILSCPQVNAKVFPFDVQGLQIRIQCAEMEGVTSLGQTRTVILTEPRLRKRMRQRDRIRMKRAKMSSMGWAETSNQQECMSHMWRLNDEDGEAFGFGEMKVLAMGGTSFENGNLYMFHVVLQRQWYPRYVFDFIIQNLQVVLASLGSLYIPFTSDMLANRMGIALMVLLTLVASTNTRPALIDTVPYSTLHDQYGQFMVILILFISLANWLVFASCWGMYREFGNDDYFDKELYMVVSRLKSGWMQDAGLCDEGWCGASGVDCVILVGQMIGQFMLIFAVVVYAQMSRINTVLHIKSQVDEPDPCPGEFSKLVLCDSGFEFTRRTDIFDCSHRAGLLPAMGCFIRIWSMARRLRRAMVSFWPMETDSFHAMDAMQKLLKADQRKEIGTEFTPEMNMFRGQFSRTDTARLLDVGSGEMGFYSYWLSPEGFLGLEGGNNKLKYKKGCTFVDHFVEAPDGAQELAKEIIERFKLQIANFERARSSITSLPGETPGKRPNVMTNAGVTSPPSAPLTATMSAPCSRNSREAAEGMMAILPCAPVSPEVPLPGEPEPPELKKESSSPSRPTARARMSQGEASATASVQSPGPSPRKAVKKQKLFMCLTGANRQMLSEDAQGRVKLRAYVSELNKYIQPYNMECLTFSPEDKDEAMYELRASEWVVQHGDLDVSNMRLGGIYRNLQQGREHKFTNLDEVLREFRWLEADQELTAAFSAAVEMAQIAHGADLEDEWGSVSDEEVHPVDSNHIGSRNILLAEDAEVDPHTRRICQILPPVMGEGQASLPTTPTRQRGGSRSNISVRSKGSHRGGSKRPADVPGTPPPLDKAMVRCHDFYAAFENSDPLKRALVRSKEFVGTMSAGSGSCQVTLRELKGGGRGAMGASGTRVLQASKREDRKNLASIPLGNRSPMLKMRLKLDGDDETVSPLSKDLPETREKTLALLCSQHHDHKRGSYLHKAGSDGRTKEWKSALSSSPAASEYITTEPAWPEDGPVTKEKLEEWRDLVACCAEELDLPRGQRGLFVGITAFFYAAKLAGCADQIHEKQEFLEAIDKKKEELLASAGSGRDLSNLTLVGALVDHVLHGKAKIVCKRNWKCDSGGKPETVVATWTLGFFLKHLAPS